MHLRLCPNVNLLMPLCRQLPSSGHTGMRLQWSISLFWNDFHLAHKMLLLDASIRRDLSF